MSLLTNIGAMLLSVHLPVAAQLGPTSPGEEVDPTVPTEPGPSGDSELVDERDRALFLLSGYHGLPSRDAFVQALSDPSAVLLSIATDSTVSAIHRDRAIAALAYWPSEQISNFYEALMLSGETPELVRHRVLGHMAVAFGSDAIGTIAPYLDDEDLQFRLTAVHALREIGTPEAFQLLRSAATTERSPIVIEAIQQAVR